MQISAEMRWFWSRQVPKRVWSWFHAGQYPPGGGLSRTDTYLLDSSQREFSMKKRGDMPWIEIKGLIDEHPQSVRNRLFLGSVQLWAKWSTKALKLDNLPSVAIHKTRLIRRFSFDTSAIREIALDKEELPINPDEKFSEPCCNVELTKIRLESDRTRWWTFGCEARGGIESVERCLYRTLAHLSASGAPELKADFELSYPAWINRLKPEM